MRRRPAFAGCADSAPPVVALEPLGGVAAVNHYPPRRAGTQTAVEIAFERIVGAGRTLECRVQVGFDISIGTNHDAVAAGRIRERQQRLLYGSKSRRPTAPVRIVAQLRDVEGLSRFRRVRRASGEHEHPSQQQGQVRGDPKGVADRPRQ